MVLLGFAAYVFLAFRQQRELLHGAGGRLPGCRARPEGGLRRDCKRRTDQVLLAMGGMLPMRSEYVAFPTRLARAAYIAARFRPFLSGSVLDVGCGEAALRGLLPGIHYTGVDVSGNPDIRLNLEDPAGLPFGDGSFECVVCSDVLEHLDSLHRVFGELVRVARRHLVVSLPNNWCNARRPIERGKGAIGHYGLPLDPPADRHRWFFGISEAADFIRGQAGTYPITIVELHATEKPRLLAVRASRRLLYPSRERYLNRYAHTLWAVLEKK